MVKHAVWASIALMPMVSGCGGSTTQDQAVTDGGGVAIATIRSDEDAVAIAVDGHYVYCAAPTPGLVRVPLSGGTPVILSNNVSSRPGASEPALAVDARNVYWSAQSCLNASCPTILLSQPVAGGTSTPVSDPAQQSVLAVAADGQNVYWLAEQVTASSDRTTAGAVMKAPSGGGTPVVVASAAFLSSGGFYRIAVDSNVIYWTDACPANSVDYCGGELMKVPVAGGTPVRLATWSGNSYSQIKVGPGGVYWAVPGTQSTMQPPPPTGILKVPLAGGDPVTVIAPPVLAIALDEANIYWSTYSDMMRAPLPSVAPATRVATTSSYNFDLAVDATSLYWVDSGRLMKLTPK